MADMKVRPVGGNHEAPRRLGGGGVSGARHRPGAHLRTDHERTAALDQGRRASAHPGVVAPRVPRWGAPCSLRRDVGTVRLCRAVNDRILVLACGYSPIHSCTGVPPSVRYSEGEYALLHFSACGVLTDQHRYVDRADMPRGSYVCLSCYASIIDTAAGAVRGGVAGDPPGADPPRPPPGGGPAPR